VQSIDTDFLQPLDEDAHGNVLTTEEQTLIMMNDYHLTPNKEDTKPAAKPEDEDTPPPCLNLIEEESINKNTNLTT
jgi:hypothetical protein